MARLTPRRLDTLKTLADAAGRRRAATITTRRPGLARGPFTASVLGFKPDAGSWRRSITIWNQFVSSTSRE